MQGNDLVSIIIPVYNVAQYLEKCVASVVAQTYKNIEILLIDDGSTDGKSGELSDQLALTDNRISVYHKPNGGLSDARNFGVTKSTGSYLCFIDSDDYIDTDMIETMYTNMIEDKTDLAICGMYQVYGNRIDQPQNQEHFVVDQKEIIKMVFDSTLISINVVNRLFPRKIFEQVKFPKGKTSEDAHVILDILRLVDRVSVDLAPKYYYVHREGSITTSSYKQSDLSVIEAYERNLQIINESFPEIKAIGEFRVYWAHFYILDKMLLTEGSVDQREKRKVIHYLRTKVLRIVKNPYVGKGRKIAAMALFFNVHFYQIFLNKYRQQRQRI